MSIGTGAGGLGQGVLVPSIRQQGLGRGQDLATVGELGGDAIVVDATGPADGGFGIDEGLACQGVQSDVLLGEFLALVEDGIGALEQAQDLDPVFR